MPRSLCAAKKEVELLGLSSVTYDVCQSGCMLYYGDDADLKSCKFCSAQCYKTIVRRREPIHKAVKKMYYFPIGERLRRLFESNTTAEHMTWHWDFRRAPGVMIYPSDSEAWKHFDIMHLEFAREP